MCAASADFPFVTRSTSISGLASHGESIALGDGLTLSNYRITNAVKCLPHENKPDTSEIRQCNAYLKVELAEFVEQSGSALLALGGVAHRAILMALQIKLTLFPFSH